MGGIRAKSRSSFHILEGTINEQQYIPALEHLMLPSSHPFQESPSLFYQDNVRHCYHILEQHGSVDCYYSPPKVVSA